MKKLEETIQELMSKEDRQDVEFRYVIAVTEIGDLGKYISHDPKLNPNARPHGTKDDEVLAYGQAFIQLAALAQLRDINLQDAIDKGLENWLEADWRKSQAKEKEKIKGYIACPGNLTGEAYLVKSIKDLEEMPAGRIVVTEFAKPNLAQYITKMLAIVTDHGGKTCHIASIAREFGLPCIVGTGNATKMIKTGDMITIENIDSDYGEVYKK
ncbi:MAG: hypothetical protein KKA65_03835 [Nanoarchaeota archaeon]|nr:hypothetical protein [Nanoarchaeota archaeon]MBU4351737.1 hypothetical protein [Nanoarchaeota archaeon]MBU4456608.1 hypothetical protein [Nanoarchaeota archaeon]MCG2719831.1 hypothetical protein [Nanoarchaeota archaeon]